MIIDCIADLHGHYPKLEGGDLLIVAGDLTARDTPAENVMALAWIEVQDYKKKIIIAGNHDNFLMHRPYPSNQYCEYLCDSGTEFVLYPLVESMEEGKAYERQKVKIWGSPWTKSFEGMNPHCKAFTVDTEEELAEKWAMIPDDVDILITHSPPKGMLDKTTSDEEVGSQSLTNKISRTQLQLHVFGHIHESYGQESHFIPASNYIGVTDAKFVNASHVNENYEPVNKPIRIIL